MCSSLLTDPILLPKQKMLLEWPLPRTVDFPFHPIFLTNVYSLCFISLMKYCFVEYAPWLYGEKNKIFSKVIQSVYFDSL